MSDEPRQALAMYNLVRGSLFAREEVASYFALENGLLSAYPSRLIDGQPFIVHSPFVNFAALPAYFLLDIVDGIVPVATALVLLWGLLVYWSLRWAWDWTAPCVGRSVAWYTRPAAIGLDPFNALGDWIRRMTPAHRWLAGALTVLTAVQVATVRSFDYAVWGPPLAIQVTGALMAAAAVVAFHELLKMMLPRWAAHVGAGLLLTATPLAFWGTQIKYHGMMMALVVLAMYWFTLGWQRKQLRWRFLAIVCGGLAVWNHLSGLFLVAALGSAELVHAAVPWTRRAGRWVRSTGWLPGRSKSHALALAALLIGLMPFFVYNTAVFGNPLTDGYFASDTGDVVGAVASGDTAVASERLEATRERMENQLEFQVDDDRWGGRLGNSVQVLFLGKEIEGEALAVITLTPVLVMAALSPLALRQGAARWSPAATLGLTLIVANWYAYAQRGPFQGDGFDARYFTMSAAPLLLFAMMGLAWAVREGRRALQAGAAAYFLGATVAFAALLMMAHKNFLLDWTDEDAQTFVLMRVLGITSYVMILVAAIGKPWLGRHQQVVLGAFLGLGILNSHMWVFTTQVLFPTVVPAHDGYAAFGHVLPLTAQLHDLAVRWLIPPKWGIAA